MPPNGSRRTLLAQMEMAVPHPDQVPAFVTNREELRRWKLVFGITRAICQRDDPVFARQLFFSDMPTDDPDD